MGIVIKKRIRRNKSFMQSLTPLFICCSVSCFFIYSSYQLCLLFFPAFFPSLPFPCGSPDSYLPSVTIYFNVVFFIYFTPRFAYAKFLGTCHVHPFYICDCTLLWSFYTMQAKFHYSSNVTHCKPIPRAAQTRVHFGPRQTGPWF